METSTSYVGALSEALRTDPRSARSNDFSHSVSAIGARAPALTGSHEACPLLHTPWSPKAFSDGSPWYKLYEWNALYCFIGVTMRVCTMNHYIEARIVDECLCRAAPERREALQARLMRLGVDGVWPFYDSEKLGDLLAGRGLVRSGRIGSATILGIRTRVLVDETFPLLRQSPHNWFSEPFLEWRHECLGE